MALILGIDVSGNQGFVLLANKGMLIDSIQNNEPMQHGAFLQPAIQSLLAKNKLSVEQLSAIAVSNGPGSYTGLRVGLASAKGLCFALNIPLITINTLQLIALAQTHQFENDIKHLPYIEIIKKNKNEEPDNIVEQNTRILFCPMIDARRMEVFFGLYEQNNTPIIMPGTAVLTEGFLEAYLDESLIVFTGTGVPKWEKICRHKNAYYFAETPLQQVFCQLAYQYYIDNSFSELVSAEPFYCKQFYDPKMIMKNKYI